MKKYLSVAVFLGISWASHAGVIDANGYINIAEQCKSFIGKAGTCEINEGGIKVSISCSTSFGGYNSSRQIICNNTGELTVSSNAPIKEISGLGLTTFDNQTKIAKGPTSTDNPVTLDVKNNFSIKINAEYYQANIQNIRFAFGSANGLTESLQAADGILYASYTNALTAANMFKGEIAKTHRGHMNRFMTSLSDGIALLDPKSTNKVSIVDWRVQENARLIVVFGTILNELLTDYDDVERLKLAINSLKSLVDQLRVSYGWERGLAGTASKASAALLSVVRLEIQELASIKMAMGETNLAPYTNILKVSGILLAKVNASKSGDMKAQREIYDLADVWNSNEFQGELAKMLNAGPDFKNLVVPKLVMLLKTVESINDLTDAGMTIPAQK